MLNNVHFTYEVVTSGFSYCTREFGDVMPLKTFFFLNPFIFGKIVWLTSPEAFFLYYDYASSRQVITVCVNVT